jgi:perosamine synthetase
MAATRVIPIALPILGEPEEQAVARVIRSGWVTQGPEVAAFESEFAAYVGAPHACAVSNCTTALHLALLGVGVGPGDEVVTVSHSFIATANAIRHCGATPVFVDIGAAGFNMDPALIEGALTERTRAIICVHQLGMPCDLVRIVGIARQHGIAVIEDAACAIGSEIRIGEEWWRIGRPYGDIACFSFHPRKVITTGDGGMLTTANPAYDAGFRLRRQHGMSIPDTVRHQASTVLHEHYAELGYNYRLTDLQAAMGRVQLTRLDAIIAERRRLAALYATALSRIPGLTLPREPDWARSNWQSYCVQLPDGVLQVQVMQELLDAGISTRRGVMNAHLELAYADPRISRAGSDLGRSEQAQLTGIVLPLFPGMTDENVQRVAEALAHALEPQIA